VSLVPQLCETLWAIVQTFKVAQIEKKTGFPVKENRFMYLKIQYGLPFTKESVAPPKPY